MPSTFPLGPHFPDPVDRHILSGVLRAARRTVLAMPVGRHRWSRGYHVRVFAEIALRLKGEIELLDRVWQCPLWRGRVVHGREAEEYSHD